MNFKLITLMVMGCLWWVNGWALRSDSEQPIIIEADQVDIDDRNGVSTYYGNVKLKQGSINIDASSIVVYSVEHRLQRIIAIGQPAHFAQRPDGAVVDINAEAWRVEYNAQVGVLILSDRAKFYQAASKFQGDRIEYNMRKDTVRASKSEQGTGRVHVVIQPGLIEQTKDKK